MQVKQSDPGPTVVLIPAREDTVEVAVQPGVDGGVAASIDVETTSLGKFTIPLNKYQLGVIAAMANWLLKLNPEQISDLRARLVRAQHEGNGNE